MEATTYHDPAVRKILEARFIAVKVDVDARPDLEERYAEYGWPATVIFSPDADELGKYRGYIAPEKLVEILNEVVTSGAGERAPATEASKKNPKTALGEEHLAWVEHAVDVEMDDYWDDEQGGWGRGQKAPVGPNNAWMLWRAERGDTEAKQKVLFTLEQQSKLLDPVWGGIYQYSAARDWDHAHFEKLMTFQAPAIENYAVAYRLTHDAKHLARARALVAYVDRFLKGPEGGFFTTQDADLHAHERGKPFLDGHHYYALGERERLANGVPRIDTHEYGKENGLAIAAYATMYEVSKDAPALASAEKAAARIVATQGLPIRRGKSAYLADNASMGLAFMRLYEVTKKPEYLDDARRIADFMLADLADEESGGFFASTRDPDAVGVFAKRRVPFEDNVTALRMLARLARATLDARYEVGIDRILRAITVPEEIKARGRWLGDYLLALEETKGVRGVAR